MDEPKVGLVERLVAIAESANIPFVEGEGLVAQDSFQAKDGWQVNVFYDGGEFDYIDEFLAPNGGTGLRAPRSRRS